MSCRSRVTQSQLTRIQNRNLLSAQLESLSNEGVGAFVEVQPKTGLNYLLSLLVLALLPAYPRPRSHSCSGLLRAGVGIARTWLLCSAGRPAEGGNIVAGQSSRRFRTRSRCSTISAGWLDSPPLGHSRVDNR